MQFIKIIIFSLCCSMGAMAQRSPVQSSSPASIKWFQINTDHFRILFPENFHNQAQHMANTLEHIREPEGKSLGITPKKISIVLQNQSAISNGFVAQAPWRSEFFAMPSQDYNFTGINDWLAFLATHEYRHMVQFQKSKTGVGKIVHYMFGQLAQSGLAFLAVPYWFWEGDAVMAETAFTRGGRGRIPRFNLLLRTNLLEGRSFGYDQQYLRSYKYNIPNHYVLGYHMVAFLRKKTGNPHIWSSITKQAWRLPLPFAFSSALKKETGVYVKQLYNEMILDLKNEWLKEQETITPTTFEKINKRKSDVYTDYAYPQPLEDGSILALKSGIGNISTLITIDPDSKEHKQFVTGPLNKTGMLSVQQNKVVWNEYRYSPRWNTRSYTIIKGYDLTSNTPREVSKQSRYAAAALSPDGQKVATVETSTTYQTRLVIVDYQTGDEIKKIDNPDNYFISMPRWSNNGKYILFVSLANEEKSIMRYEVKSGKIETLLTTGTENVGHPIQHGNYLLYNSPFSGIDNIYAYDIINKNRLQVTSSKYGAYNPAVSSDGRTIYYNDQSKDGLDIVKIPFDTSSWTSIDKVKKVSPGIYSDLITKQEGNINLTRDIPSTKYPSKRYRRITGMINPHSWGLYLGSSFSELDIGVSSKDVLSTTVVNLGYRYNVSEQAGFWYAGLSYQGLYPIFDLEIRYGKRSAEETYIKNESKQQIKFDWNELNVETGLRIPLLTTRSKYASNISIGNFIGITEVNGFKNSEDGKGRFLRTSPTEGLLFRSYVDNSTLVYNHLNFKINHSLKRSRRDIYSRWGQAAKINWRSTYPGNEYTGKQFSALLTLYFPGLFPHHSFWGYGAYQYTQIEQKIDNYLFRNQAPTPRGQSVSLFQDYYMTSANYTFPILYPDLALGPVLNLQRMWGTLFIDYAIGENKSAGTYKKYTSIGGELLFDINIIRLLPKINVGIRYSYAIEESSNSVQFIIGRIGF